MTLTATSALPTGVSIPTATNTHRSTATITDNDDPPSVTVDIADATAVLEDAGSASFHGEPGYRR